MLDPFCFVGVAGGDLFVHSGRWESHVARKKHLISDISYDNMTWSDKNSVSLHADDLRVQGQLPLRPPRAAAALLLPGELPAGAGL